MAYLTNQLNGVFNTQQNIISDSHQKKELGSISKVTDNIYLSGIFALDTYENVIKKLNIRCIICCVDKAYVTDVHDKVLLNNPDLTILYLPYNDRCLSKSMENKQQHNQRG